MAYIEPGVYSKTVSSRPNTGNGGPRLIPLVLGTGASVLSTTEVLTRSSEATDTLPVEAVDILSIGYTSKKADFTKGVDYELDTSDRTKIKWLNEPDSGTKSPAQGETYSVTFSYNVPDSQYDLRLISSSQLETIYGPNITVGGEINNLVTAAGIIFESGVNELYIMQVKPAGLKVNGTDYQKALDKYAQFVEDIWRIVPADLGDDINSVIDGHIKKCSSYEERKERCGVYAKEGGESLSTASDVETKIGGYAESKDNERISVVFPPAASKVMSDGSLRTLTGQFVAAAYVGMEASSPVYQSKTRMTSGVFNELLGPKLTRTEKNRLAEKGVMIFEQPNGAGTNMVCRHQLTTNMASAEYRENSVLACKDYVAKMLRNVLDTYIGKYNVTADTITKVTGSINATFSNLVADGIILEGALLSLAQDEYNPDTLIVEVSIKVPYPCNYIKLTIVSA